MAANLQRIESWIQDSGRRIRGRIVIALYLTSSAAVAAFFLVDIYLAVSAACARSGSNGRGSKK